MRKIIDFKTLGESEHGARTIFALCDDGTLWSTTADSRLGAGWKRINDVPQDEAKIEGKYCRIIEIYGPEDANKLSCQHQNVVYFDNVDFYKVGEIVDIDAAPVRPLLAVLQGSKGKPYCVADGAYTPYSYIATLEPIEC